MVENSSDILQAFLSSYLGIAAQASVFIAGIIPAIKYVNKRLDDRIDRHIGEKVKPVVADLCKQLEAMKKDMTEFQNDRVTLQKAFESKTDTSIRYIDKILMHLQGLKDDKEIARYRPPDEGAV